MRKLLQNIMLLGGCLLMFGCCGVKVEEYKDVTPVFDIREFFNGNLEGYGQLMDSNGKVTRRFTFTMEGSFKGNSGTLREHFLFDNGEKQGRVWMLNVQDDNHFTAQASDGVGLGSGKQFGNTVNMRYVLSVPSDGKTYDINFDDWLYLQSNGEVLNQTRLSKFGFTVGRLNIVIRKK